jgi:hypothetical protein
MERSRDDKATRMGILNLGGMAERFKAPALKAGEGLRPPGVRIPVPPPEGSSSALRKYISSFEGSVVIVS